MTSHASVNRAAKNHVLCSELLTVLVDALRRNPELRVCQLIVNATGCDDPFYVEDDALVRALDSYRMATR
jgi:hypothetical protein